MLKGVTSYSTSSKPRASEYDDESIPHINMTCEAPVRESSETGFTEKEDAMNDLRGEFISSGTIERVRRIINYLSTGEDDAVDFMDDKNLFNALNSK